MKLVAFVTALICLVEAKRGGNPPARGNSSRAASKHAPRFCQDEPAIGSCYGMNYRFHYDAKSNSCVLFHYGGCGGNRNRFIDPAMCQKVCGNEKTVLDLSIDEDFAEIMEEYVEYAKAEKFGTRPSANAREQDDLDDLEDLEDLGGSPDALEQISN